jgi:hypothetical protein
MDLKNQVCSLELAKKLKELRVKQESLFYWSEYQTRRMKAPKWAIMYEEHGTDWYSAFTVAELGEMLPPGYHSVKVSAGKEFMVFFYEAEHSYMDYAQTENTEADARAAMLVYLIENNLINPKDQ